MTEQASYTWSELKNWWRWALISDAEFIVGAAELDRLYQAEQMIAKDFQEI